MNFLTFCRSLWQFFTLKNRTCSSWAQYLWLKIIAYAMQLCLINNHLVTEIQVLILEGLMEIWLTVLARFCTQTFHLAKIISIFSSN